MANSRLDGLTPESEAVVFAMCRGGLAAKYSEIEVIDEVAERTALATAYIAGMHDKELMLEIPSLGPEIVPDNGDSSSL